jgi:hypothetical protein
MKTKAKELNVDFIGGQEKSLTEEEQLKISSFLKDLKENQKLNTKNKSLKKDKQLV